ncbi:MAG: aminopeptidase P family protein [Tissierellales bacterium]|nr:aminopeptidase P family protein [Tissierellales bacterium]
MNSKYLKRLVDSMNKNKLDAMLIIPSEELQFVAGFSPYLCERFQGLFVKNNGDYFYFCNLLSKDEVEHEIGPERVYTWSDAEFFASKLKHLLIAKNLIGADIGVNSAARAFNIIDIMNHIDVNFVNGKSVLENIRIIKDSEEIRLLKEAARLTDQVMQEIFEYIKPGLKEEDIIIKIEQLFIEKGMEPKFAIVASGPNAASPHYSGNQRVIQKQDSIILDIGGSYQGLCSDMTRTAYIGEPTEKQKEAYRIVLESQLMGIEASKQGVQAKEIDHVSREIIEKSGNGQYFFNRLGHGIGYSVHEAPYINAINDLVIENGMVFSVEPGIYIKDEFGIRIEDIVVIEDGKGVPINLFTKEMIIL